MNHYLVELVSSFRWAIQGVIQGFKNEKNLKIIIIVAIIAVTASTVFNITKIEMLVVMVISALVVTFELLNSAIEKLIDEIHPQYNKTLGLVKDYLAGSVLILAVTAVIIGLIVFIPPLLELI